MDIALYQIYYDEEQESLLDSDFIPYYNEPAGDILTRPREMCVMQELYKTKKYINSEYTGCVSWKFRKKVKMSGREFIDAINMSSRADVYFVSCGQRSYKNIWIQGEKYHPGIIALTQRIFDDIGYDINVSTLTHTKDRTAFCNFWAGSPIFWQKYFEFVTPVIDYIDDLPADLQHIQHVKADRKINSNIIPFIYERLFTTLLAVDTSIQYQRISRG